MLVTFYSYPEIPIFTMQITLLKLHAVELSIFQQCQLEQHPASSLYGQHPQKQTQVTITVLHNI